jgi:hypothetical protein
MKNSKETIDYYFEALEIQVKNLSKWEEDFIDSIKEQWQDRRSLSERQEEILERIYSERTP